MGERYPPPPKGYLSDTRAIPYENRQMGAIPPLRYYLGRVLQAIWGGISHWAAKFQSQVRSQDLAQLEESDITPMILRSLVAGRPFSRLPFSKGDGGATTKGNDQSRPRKNPRASKRTSRRRLSCGNS